MASQQDILRQIGRTGWTVVSEVQHTTPNKVSPLDWKVTHPNDPYQTDIPDGNLVWNIAGPGGQNQQVVVKSQQKDTATGGTGFGQYSLVEAPSQTPSQPTSTQPSQISAPASEQYILVRDPTTGAIAAQPNPNYRPQPAGQRPTEHVGNRVYQQDASGNWQVVIEGDKSPHIVGGTAASDQYLIVEDAAGNRSQIPNPNYRAAKPSVIGGTNTADQFTITQNPDGTTSQSPNPNYVAPKPNVVGGVNTSDQFIITQNPDGTTSQTPNPNYTAPKPVLASGGATGDKYIVTMAPDGTLTNTANPNYQPGKPSLEPGYQNQARIPQLVQGEDGKWTVQWIDNQGRPTVPTDTLQGLAQQIGVKLADGTIPLDDAKGLFDMAHQVISDQTARQQANNQGGQIGAGLLQNRATNVAGQENTLLGLANNKNFGLGGPLPPGLWAGVHNEVMGNMTQAGGGQQVYDTAAALVNRANPQLATSPAGPQAISQLAAMLQVHQQATGEQHPAAAAVQPQITPNNPNGDGSGFQGNRSGTGGNGVGVANTPFQAPTTTIAPDGTVTIQHTPGQDSGSSSSSAFRAPVMAGVM